jgi:cytochrome c oxidase assembly protein Cox11
MSVLTLFGSVHCHLDPIREQLCRNIGYDLLTDNDVVQYAADLSGIDAKRIRTVFRAKTSISINLPRKRSRPRPGCDWPCPKCSRRIT